MKQSATPRLAATVLLLRDTKTLEVFLVERPSASGFLGGAHVFPGGKVDPADCEPRVASRLRPEAKSWILARLAGVEPAESKDEARGIVSPGASRLDSEVERLAREDQALAIHVAALREVFEEVGVLIGARLTHEGKRRAARLRDEGRPFAEVLEAEALVLDLTALVPFSHWITPSAEPRRFDTRFFVAQCPDGQDPMIETDEMVSGAWMSPSDAIARHEAGAIFLAPPTLLSLHMLASCSTSAEALASASRRPIHTILPKLTLIESQPTVLLPWDPVYGRTEGEGTDGPTSPPSPGALSRVVFAPRAASPGRPAYDREGKSRTSDENSG